MATVLCPKCKCPTTENSMQYVGVDIWMAYFECENCHWKSPETYSEESREDAVEGAIINAQRRQSYKPLNKKELWSRRNGDEIFIVHWNYRHWVVMVNPHDLSESKESCMAVIDEDDGEWTEYLYRFMYSSWTAWDHEPTEKEYNNWLKWQAEYEKNKR